MERLIKNRVMVFPWFILFLERKIIQYENGLSERLLELHEGKKEVVAYPYNNYLFTAWPSDRV